jgi:hypothetical protein
MKRILAAAWLSMQVYGPVVAAEMPPLDFRIVSQKEIVFDWRQDRCEDLDIPDTALGAFRRADGQVVGFATHYVNRRFFIGPDGRFTRDCRIVFSGRQNPLPSAYDDKIWIVAPWTTDGRTVYALGHNEYQGHSHPGYCSFKGYTECWYNSVVLLQSHDGGATFGRVRGTLPVATPAFRYDELQGEPRGFFGPTTFVERDGHPTP